VPVISAKDLEQIGTALFDAVGSPHDESAWVAETLVRSSLAGHDSHGVVRFTEYANNVRKGLIHPGAEITVEQDMGAMAVLNAHLTWGQSGARRAMELAMEKAEQHAIGVVAVRECPHVGRLGEYVEMAARRDMVGYAVVNSHGGGGVVAPWGGRDGRFTPNPIAFGSPSGEEWPVLMDITTSAVPEGKVRIARHRGQQLPPDCILDADGNPSTDPNALYGPPIGALLPLGGAMGHKGYALSVMTEVLAGVLSEAGASGEDTATKGNGLFIQAINIRAFTMLEDFIARTQKMIEYVKSSRLRPGVEEVLFPGEPEYRTIQKRLKDGITVEDSVWAEIQVLADELGVEVGIA
jgi:hydroxycarboxylate dehydrogenase B